MAEVDVHRVRWGSWTPSPVRGLRRCPQTNLLAIGRENGQLEICNTNEKFYIQLRIPGRQDFHLQAIDWSHSKKESGRLFGLSLRGFLFEYDFKNLSIKNIRDSYGGAAWCFVVNPKENFENMAVGCEDGAVRLFSYANNRLEYTRTFPTTNNRILSLAYHPNQERLFLGCSDGTIRCVDENNGISIFRLAGDFGRGITTFIWSLCVLSDSTIISGDDKGTVQIWDGEVGALMTSLKQQSAEILTIVSSFDENQVFVSGVDSKVACFHRIPVSGADKKNEKLNNSSEDQQLQLKAYEYNWVYTTSYRPHSHDVYSLCAIPAGGSNQKPLLLSGGLDCKICTYSLQDFSSSRPNWILPVPPSGIASASNNYSMVAIKQDNHIDLWGITFNANETKIDNKTKKSKPDSKPKKNIKENNKKRKSKTSNESELDEDENEGDEEIVNDANLQQVSQSNLSPLNDINRCVLRLQVQLQGDSHILAHALSPDGRLLCVSRAELGTKMWFVSSTGDDLTLQPVRLPIKLKSIVCSSFKFTMDGYRLIATESSGDIFILAVDPESIEKAIVRKQGNEQEEKNAETEDIEINDEEDSVLNKKRKMNKKKIEKNKRNNVESENDCLPISGIIKHKKYALENLKNEKNSLDELMLIVRHVDVSSDGLFLAVSDSSHSIYIYDLDSFNLHWKVPTRNHLVTSLAFSPPVVGRNSQLKSLINISTLLVSFSDNTLQLVDVEARGLSRWSVENQETTFPLELRDRETPIESIQFDSKHSNVILFYGKGFTGFLDLLKPMSLNAHILHHGQAQKVSSTSIDNSDSKNKIQSKNSGNNVVIVEKYRGMISVGFIANSSATKSQMVVLENPWMRVLEKLPDPLTRKRYGT